MKGQSQIDSSVWLQHAWRNRTQSLTLIAAMGAFLALLGWLVRGPDGVLILVVVGIAGVLLNPSTSPWWVMRLYGAPPISRQQAPDFGRSQML